MLPPRPGRTALATNSTPPEEPRINSPFDQETWEYAGHSERGRVQQYTGHVTYLGGAAGERLRGELAAVIEELLRWAADARAAAEESPKNDQGTAA